MKDYNDAKYNNRDYSAKEARKLKRRRARRRLLICVTIVSMVLAAVLLVTVLRIRTLRALRGDFVRKLDITDQVVSQVTLWLNDVEGADIDPDWVRDKGQEICADVELTFIPEGLTKGTFTETLNTESYAHCSEEAYRITGECLRELIVNRLTAVGYSESLSNDEADALITEALGMSLDNYLKNAGVDIIPDYNELAEEINRSGEYKIRRMTLEWTRDGADAVDSFSVTKDSLAVLDAGFIYTRVESNDEEE